MLTALIVVHLRNNFDIASNHPKFLSSINVFPCWSDKNQVDAFIVARRIAFYRDTQNELLSSQRFAMC